MLILKNVYHKYDESWVLHDISFIFENKKYVLIGPSGVGKSTLLHIAGGIIKPKKGSVKSEYENAFIFQTSNLLEDLTVLENIEIAAQIRKRKCSYSQLIDLLGIEKILDRFPNQISGGEKQRVAIVRALSFGANFIFADEPTGNLDPDNARMIRNIFSLINKELKIGFLISTHDYDWLAVADKKLKLESGTLCSFL